MSQDFNVTIKWIAVVIKTLLATLLVFAVLYLAPIYGFPVSILGGQVRFGDDWPSSWVCQQEGYAYIPEINFDNCFINMYVYDAIIYLAGFFVLVFWFQFFRSKLIKS